VLTPQSFTGTYEASNKLRRETASARYTIKNNRKDEFRRALPNLLRASRYNSAAHKTDFEESRESVVKEELDFLVGEKFQAQPLTKRENEVARLVAQGLANKTVAGQLGLCEGTVKLHLHSIYRKLRVTNRAGLILTAMADIRA
jgi:DNA-binding NarL/FixJ family response regulator